MNETYLLDLINQTGGIPIQATITTTTNMGQFWINIIFASVMVFWFFGSMTIPLIHSAISKIVLKRLKNKVKRNIVVIKHTSQGLFSQGMIDQSTLTEINNAMLKFEGKDFDLILHTPGGEVFSAQFISRLLKKYPGKIRAIVPMYSMSGGTILALSCNEIYMSESATLGPIDVQMGSLFKFGSAKAWEEVVKKKGNKAEDSSITFNLMGKQYTKSIRNNASEAIGDKLVGKQKETFLDFITNGEVEHAYNLTPEVLSSFGFDVKKISPLDNVKLFKVLKSIKEGVTYV
jgi:ClpP class serine protease